MNIGGVCRVCYFRHCWKCTKCNYKHFWINILLTLLFIFLPLFCISFICWFVLILYNIHANVKSILHWKLNLNIQSFLPHNKIYIRVCFWDTLRGFLYLPLLLFVGLIGLMQINTEAWVLSSIFIPYSCE